MSTFANVWSDYLRRRKLRSMSTLRAILDDIDYLVPLISYLGLNPYWWARSAPSLAKELTLDTVRVQEMFERYPMIFRKSAFIASSAAYSFSLHLRYARRSDGDTDHPPTVSTLPVLSEAQVISLIEFLIKISTLETSVRSAARTSTITMTVAIISAITAIAVSIVRH